MSILSTFLLPAWRYLDCFVVKRFASVCVCVWTYCPVVGEETRGHMQEVFRVL